MFQNSLPMQHYQHHPAAGMVLGCFIGVMILLVIMIVLLAVSDHRVSSMLTNQNNQMNNLYKIGEALGAKHIMGRAQTRSAGGTKSGFLTGTNGTQANAISPAQYPNMLLARQNQQLGSSIAVGGSNNYNPVLDGCGSGNCGGGSSSGGLGLYNVQSVSTGTNAPTNSTEAAAELAYFESMLGPEFAAAAGTTGTTGTTQSRPTPSRPAPSRPPPSRPSRPNRSS